MQLTGHFDQCHIIHQQLDTAIHTFSIQYGHVPQYQLIYIDAAFINSQRLLTYLIQLWLLLKPNGRFIIDNYG